MTEPSDADVELANELLASWNNGDGTSKSELERIHWDDGSSHGRRFDRFIRQTLGVPDAVAYFVKPGEVPDELVGVVDQYVVLPKVGMAARPNLAASQVMAEVVRRTGFRFHSQHHAEASRRLNIRPPAGEDDRTLDLQHAEYITSFKRYLYSQPWIDLLVSKCSTPDGFLEATGREAIPVPAADDGAPM